MFIDGYGELSATQKRAIDATSGRGSSVSPNLGVEMDQLLLDSPAAPAASTATCAWVPQNFTMPTVSEAMTTMRRIQSDVNGLNAVAEEQRAERLQRRNAGGVTGALEVPNLTSLESQRLVDEWTTEYRSHSRDLLCPAQIPQQLLAEAGTDYLAEEFRQTRRQYVAAVRDTHDVEIWRGEVDARGRRYGKQRRVSGSLTGSKSLLAMVGATKLGLPTKPLWNPTSNLSAEEYQQWVTERDALFSSAGHRE
uniref:WGS project CAEQ00000000 data, annotated contig 905 n=1 Tax=Trypanosoma congolense (strain IL3000) TaxID=1068625 RepID=F9WJF8_TRYCI|nr:unnamed protein product [Trypanosoma congolense IL3000]